jgi:deoxyhypusine synthase
MSLRAHAPVFLPAGAGLRAKGLNRAGNLLIPNSNYCDFEDWVMPILDKLLAEQQSGERATPWTPSAVVRRLGLEINNPESVCYWAAVNDIPIYCPALTDGSLGDMLFFHSYRSPGLVIDLVADVKAMNEEAMLVRQPKKTGMLILGGGVAKHHIANANLMRNGADFCVYVNTAAEFDGCDSGARPDEAVSWGKVRADATPVKLYADATLVFPLLVAQTFATHFEPRE